MHQNIKKCLGVIAILSILWVLSSNGLSQQQSSLDNARNEIVNKSTANSAVQYSETGLAGAWYLSFPLAGASSSSQLVNTVFDHSGGWYAHDGKIVAFTGETGDTNCMYS